LDTTFIARPQEKVKDNKELISDEKLLMAKGQKTEWLKEKRTK